MRGEELVGHNNKEECLLHRRGRTLRGTTVRGYPVSLTKEGVLLALNCGDILDSIAILGGTQDVVPLRQHRIPLCA
eukprot:863187-Pelagomonas_calceolata.AAC.3